MKNQFEQLDGDEVVSVKDYDKILVSHVTFTVRQFLEATGKQLGISKGNSQQRWIEDGVDCEVLSPEKNWRKGKIRISLEFCPDELEGSQSKLLLDDIRQMQTGNSQ